MTTADQIRALADTGTPGPWRYTDSEVVNDVWQAGLTVVGVDGEPVANVADEWYEPEGQDEDATPFHDAAKIVAAVNALPEVADYDDAVMAYFQHQTECTSGPSCPTLAAKWVAVTTHRARLYKALGVTP